MGVEFVNLTQYKISKNLFKDIFQLIQEEGIIKKEAFIEVVLIGQNRIRNINKRLRGKNQVTDILSFAFSEVKKPTKKELQFTPLDNKENLTGFIEPPKIPQNFGEILLCPSRIKKQAKRFKKTFKEELTLVFIHGLLHLLGYDHKDTKSTKEMRKREKEILSSYFKSEKLTKIKKENKI